MNKMLVVSFKNERDAFNGMSALKTLSNDGSVTVYNSAVIQKDEDGIVVRDASGTVLTGTSIGFLIGALVGVLGGPAGLALGAFSGSSVGLAYDLYNSGVDAEFVQKVSASMDEGSVNIVAEVYEEWVIPVDTKMSENNGVVIRKLKNEVINDQIDEEIALSQKEFENFKLESQKVSGAAKESLQKYIETAKETLGALKTKTQEKLDKTKVEYESKSAIINTQLKDVSAEHKDRLKNKLVELKISYDEAALKLENSLHKIKEIEL